MPVQVMEAVSFDRNIVQYYGAWLEQDDAPFLVMEYMEVRSDQHPRALLSRWAYISCQHVYSISLIREALQ